MDAPEDTTDKETSERTDGRTDGQRCVSLTVRPSVRPFVHLLDGVWHAQKNLLPPVGSCCADRRPLKPISSSVEPSTVAPCFPSAT